MPVNSQLLLEVATRIRNDKRADKYFVIAAFSKDGTIKAKGFHAAKDVKPFFTSHNIPSSDYIELEKLPTKDACYLC